MRARISKEGWGKTRAETRCCEHGVLADLPPYSSAVAIIIIQVCARQSCLERR